jgi:hypothetical protein
MRRPPPAGGLCMKPMRDNRGRVVGVASAVCIVCLTAYLLVSSHTFDATQRFTPWQSIGGCGAGGSGGGATGIRWFGEGVGGCILQAEVLPKVNFGRTFFSFTTAPRISYRPQWQTELGVTLPIMVKLAEVQPQTNIDPRTYYNAGRGDLSVDIQRSFGVEGQFAWSVELGMPTGQYDTRRGTDRTQIILPASVQKGQGIYAATGRLAYTRDLNAGFLYFDGSLYWPFMLSFSGKNSLLSTDYALYTDAIDNRERFYYHFKPYGESDRGDYYPPALNFNAAYAYRGSAKYVHSVQLNFTAPLGVRWIHSYVPTHYDPYPDPDNRAWDVVLGYGLEFRRDRLPLFLGIGLPIHSRKGTPTNDRYDPKPFAQWNAPDWGALGEEWIFAFGFRAGMF